MKKLKEKFINFLDNHISIAFPAPAMITLFIVVIFPIIYNIYMSFSKWKIGLGSPKFIGLQNYFDAFSDPRFWNGLKVMFFFSGLSLSLEIVLGLLIAVYFNKEFKGSNFVQTIYIFPFAATPVAIALIWRIMLNPQIGVLNYFLSLVGLPGSLWISDARTVIISLVMVDVWKWTPMITLIVLAGLKSLPKDPYEAAIIDGANAFHVFSYITLPLIRPVLITALTLRSLDNLKEFDIIYTITQGGPGIASETLYLYSYKTAFSFFKAGYGSTLIIIVFLLVLLFNVVMNKIRYRT
ncbi:MAG TPA: sugar ABC transporter permease, partial [Candidatus Atribacteria bacterium]|nr:sugar ABC transporter permease [Candidatus Atribacteria bacterium]